MLNSKQRAYLKSLASKITPTFQVGKLGVGPELIKSVDETLEARELIKITILNNCNEDINYVASAISERTKSNIVQIVGKKIVLYRTSKKNPKIELPKK